MGTVPAFFSNTPGTRNELHQELHFSARFPESVLHALMSMNSKLPAILKMKPFEDFREDTCPPVRRFFLPVVGARSSAASVALRTWRRTFRELGKEGGLESEVEV